MSAYSKSFYATLAKCSCDQINHPGKSCWWFLGANLRNVMPGCAQFFVPLVLLAPIRKLNEVTIDDLKESLTIYCYMCFYNYWISVASQSLSCALYHLQYKYTPEMCMMPISVGNGLTFLMPPKLSAICANSTWTMLTESYLMRDDSRAWRLICHSTAVRTAIFMCMGAIVMDVPGYIKREGIFWFMQPAARHPIPAGQPSAPSPVMDAIRPVEERVCLHTNSSCDQFIGAGISAYLKIGFSIEAVRLVITHFAEIRASPLGLAYVVWRRTNWRLIAFLASYSAMYRGIYCLLNRMAGKHTSQANLIAAFVSASSYALYPNRTLLAHAIVSAFRLVWLRLFEDVVPDNRWAQLVYGLPWPQMLHMFGVGYMFHIRVFYPYWAPSLMMKATELVSGGSFHYMISGTTRALLGFPMDK